MAIYRGIGGAGENNQDATITAVTQQATNAATSATNSASSASAAAASATLAEEYKIAAGTSEAYALAYSTSASENASNASLSSSQATLASEASQAAQLLSGSFANDAEGSATAAAASAASILGAETNSAASAAAALVSEGNAATSETNAAVSAAAALVSEGNSATSETNAAASATTATTKANEASSSASSAATSVTTATTKANEASASASSAATSETNAAASATTAGTAASNAVTSEINADSSETNAATSASSAYSSATAAASSASSAATSETNAAASALSASNDAATISATYDAFDDRYLGNKTSDPATDNDGNALLTGALYYDSVSGVMKVFSGTNWVAAYASAGGALNAVNNLSDVDSISTARSNLGLGTAAVEDVSAFVTPNSTTTLYSLTTTDGMEVGGSMVITGNLTVNGTTTTIDTANLAVEDNMIYLNAGSTVTNPDLGFAGNYNAGTYAHAGFFRDATNGRWKPFDGYTPEPDASPEIDTSHASFNLGSIEATNFYGNLVGNADTATLAATATNVAYSGLTGTVPTWNQNTTGNAATANYATTAGTANAVPYGNLTGTVPTWNQNTTGNAATANYATTAGSAPASDVYTWAKAATKPSYTYSEVGAPSTTGTNASGTWGISISGNAGTATYATSAGSAPASDVYSWAKTASKPSYTYSEVGAPSTTGTNASGTWGISISGNASSATTASNAAGAFTVPGTLTVGNSGSSDIFMVDTDEGTRRIHCNSNQIGFLKQDSNWGSFCTDDGSWVSVGNVTAYSDERLKKDWEEVKPNFVDQLANVKSGTYTRTDSDERQAGVSAQSLQELLPETVIAGNDGILSVAYGNAALVAVVELAKEVVALRAELNKLKGI